MLLQASLMHRVADGPNWQIMAELVGSCRRYWWSAVLYVQNYVNPRYQVAYLESSFVSMSSLFHKIDVLFYVIFEMYNFTGTYNFLNKPPVG